MAKHCIIPEDAPTVWSWFSQRGGIAVWNSESKIRPGEIWTTALRTTAGQEPNRPHKKAGQIILTITDPNDVDVRWQDEVTRIPLYVRRGSILTLLDPTGDKLRQAMALARQEDSDAWHEYEKGEVVVYVPYFKQSLPVYMRKLAEWNSGSKK